MTDQRPDSIRWSVLWPLATLAAILLAGWLIYRPALSGTFLLDDYSNLAGLQAVTDVRSAANFVLSGNSGPLGRPIALASFLPQASSWGQDATPFLQVNIFIHLFNGLLVFLFSRQLARAVVADRDDSLLLALGTTAIWLLMPLLASSSLLIVQRMTTLSATFVLLGLNGYLAARCRVTGDPRAALASMSAVLVLCTILAAFTKENGILLPTLVLVVEATLLKPPPEIGTRLWIAWRGIFLAAPALLTVGFVLAQVPYPDEFVTRRGFSALERLFSEASILWEYLLNAFFAAGADLGPFHESRGASNATSEPLAWAAVAAWIAAIAAATRWRRRYPVATFAVFWFLAGHLLESTTIPLELYFEHRNYLPIVGPVFALCYFVLQIAGRFRVISRAAFAIYVAINAGILFGLTSMWGEPLLAATAWHKQDPTSVRAATTLASRQLTTSGPEPAIDTLRRFAAAVPAHAYIRIPELNLSCMMAPQQDHSELVGYLQTSLPSVAFSLTTGEMLDQLLTASLNSRCQSVQPADIADLATAVIENPRYSGSIGYNRIHHMLMARIARVTGDSEATLDHLERAIDIQPGDDLNFMVVTTLVDAGRFEEARDFIRSARNRLSPRPLKRYNSARHLDELLTYVNESEKFILDPAATEFGD